MSRGVYDYNVMRITCVTVGARKRLTVRAFMLLKAPLFGFHKSRQMGIAIAQIDYLTANDYHVSLTIFLSLYL